jgi:uncharacterized protein YdaU (DUF1376 family)
VNFYKHHLGDYAAATSHLSWDEDCAYRRLIDQYYKRAAPLPVDPKECCRLARATSPTQRKAVETVLREFFTEQSDGWHQKRCDIEIENARAQAETNRQVAEQREVRRRARIVNETSDESIHESSTVTSVEREPSHKPLAISHKPLTNEGQRLSPSASLQAHSSANAEEPGLELTADRITRANGSAPDCPYQAIAEAYHEELPELPSIVVLSPLRKRTLQARWREVCTAEHFNADQGMEFFRDFFRRIKSSDFLIGKAPPKPGGRSFRADFDWILNPANFGHRRQ